jgi:hypothetical protein
MKTLFAALIITLAATLRAEPVDPMTGTGAEGQVSGIAGKFSDVYSRNPSLVSEFTIGSSIREGLASEGIESITLVCIDGFTQSFQIGETALGKTQKIIYKSPESAIVYFEDGTSLHATWYQCSARPITFILYRKIKNG